MGKTLLLDSLVFHVFNKSIEGHRIFETNHLKTRFHTALSYYNQKKITIRLSVYLLKHDKPPMPLMTYTDNHLLKVLAYCIMPDHYHLLVEVSSREHLSLYIKNVEISYTRYLNLISKRKGPLWQSRFKHIHIRTNAQLSHVSRYIHLNPTTALLVENPEDWVFSSYQDYISKASVLRQPWNRITFKSPVLYKKYVEDRKDYQRKLRRIKNHIF